MVPNSIWQYLQSDRTCRSEPLDQGLAGIPNKGDRLIYSQARRGSNWRTLNSPPRTPIVHDFQSRTVLIDP